MKQWIYLAPPAVLAAVGLYLQWRFGNIFYDPALVRRPGGFWHLFRILDDGEWTERGRVVRRQWARLVLAGFAVACAALALAALVDARL